jgi:hypothetical protein
VIAERARELRRAMVAAKIATLGEGRPSGTAPIGAVSQPEATMPRSVLPLLTLADQLPDAVEVPERCPDCAATVRDLLPDGQGRYRVQLLHSPTCPAYLERKPQ